MKATTSVMVSVLPSVADTNVRCHERNPHPTGGGPPTSIVAIVCAGATIQFSTREQAVAWVAHVHAAVVDAVRAANEALVTPEQAAAIVDAVSVGGR